MTAAARKSIDPATVRYVYVCVYYTPSSRLDISGLALFLSLTPPVAVRIYIHIHCCLSFVCARAPTALLSALSRSALGV